MKSVLLIIFLIINLYSFSQKTTTRDTITISNAPLINKYDENDIESLVTFYFASRIRKDNRWVEVLGDSAEWSNKMKYSIRQHNSWEFIKFKNIGLYTSQRGNTYVKVYFIIKFGDKVDDGTDDVEIVKRGEKWYITSVPN